MTKLDETAEMASVSGYQTAKGCRYRARWRDASARQRERRGFISQREAWLFVAGLEGPSASGGEEISEAARVQVGELAELWLANKIVALKPSSFSPLRTAWRVHVAPTWAHVSIGAIVPSAVETWVRQLADGTAPERRTRPIDTMKPRSPSVVIRAVGVLAGILDMALRDGRIASNPARDVTNMPHKSVASRRRYLTNQEVFRLAAATPDLMRRTLVLTLAYTGVRWGEAVGLTVGDVDFQKRRLCISRTATELMAASS